MTQQEFIDKIIDAGFKVLHDSTLNKYIVVDNIKHSILLDDNQGYGYKDFKSAVKGYLYKKAHYRDYIEANIIKSIN